MLRVFLCLLLALFPGAVAADVEEREIAGHRVVIVAPSGRSDAPLPLLIALHGGGGSIDHFRRNTGLEHAALARDVRLVFVEGTAIGPGRRGFTWNAGACCGPAARRGTDDASALAKVISELRPVDADGPVILFGHSNGAMMAYRMACEYAGLVDGVVAVSGALVLPNCADAFGVFVLHIHGSDDRHVPMEGGKGPDAVTQTDYPSTVRTLAMLEGAGAETELLVIKKAGHSLRSLNQVAQAQLGQQIAQIALAVLMQR